MTGAAVLALALAVAGFDREPTVAQVQAAVAAGFESELEMADGASTRARWAHALPQRVAVRVRGEDANTFDDGSSDDGWSQKARVGGRFGWQVDVMWDLSRLAYDPRAARERERAAALARQKRAAVDVVSRLYFQRRRMQVAFLALEPADAKRRSAVWLDIAELTARIDAATEGLLRQSNVAWWEP